jgi:hypothetical protein
MCHCRRSSYCCVTVGQYPIRHGPRSEEVNWIGQWKWVWREAYVKAVHTCYAPVSYVSYSDYTYKERAAARTKMVPIHFCKDMQATRLPLYVL